MKLGIGLRVRKNTVVGSYGSTYTQVLVDKAIADGVDLSDSTAYLSTLDNTLVQLESAGILAKLDVLWSFASTNAALAKYNVIDPDLYYCTEIGLPTFTALKGFNSLGNGSNIINTNWNPSINGVNLTLNNASLCVWHFEAPIASGVNQVAAGAGSSLRLISIHSGGTTTRFSVNSAGTSSTSTLLSNDFVHIDRSVPFSQEMIINGVEDISSGVSSASVPNQNLAIGAESTAGTSPYNGNVSIVMAGASLYAERSQLYTILANHMASL